MKRMTCGFVALLACACAGHTLAAPPTTAPGGHMLDRYFRGEIAAISARCLADVKTLEDWTSRREEYRRQLLEMLGLWPSPAVTDLKPVITGKIDHGDYTVEKLQFQSQPGLYVTADVFVPNHLDGNKAPAILYVCGHSRVIKDGVSYGNKTAAQHHGAWFARNGFVCLIPDSLEFGEIDGIHHGLYRLGMWEWLSRGYTPAGVEVWNAMRCIDYLQGRPEVDAQRLGMTGRSGGGATSWYTAAVDERIKVVVPTAGMTDLQNQVVDGVIEGHCDCMFFVNTYRWDFPMVAALMAPRPMLISNSDKDTIFPLDGVERLHWKVRNIYTLYNADDKLGLLITEGPHKDTQDLQVPAFRWFNRFLKNDTSELKDALAEPVFTAEELRVFPVKGEPGDSVNGKIQETFVPIAPPPQAPESVEAWEKMREGWMKGLREKTFAGWPAEGQPLNVRKLFKEALATVSFEGYEFESQPGVTLRLYVARKTEERRFRRSTVVRVHVLDPSRWEQWLGTLPPAAAGYVAQNGAVPEGLGEGEKLRAMMSDEDNVAWFAPRGVGLTAWGGDAKEQTQIRRRFELIGQTLEGMRVWDVRRAVQTINGLDSDNPVAPVEIEAEGKMSGIVLYASLFENTVNRLVLRELPSSHVEGPDLLNVLKTLDLPAAVAMAAERCKVRLTATDESAWDYPPAVAKKLAWKNDQLEVVERRE